MKKKNIKAFKDKVLEESKRLSIKETYDPRAWKIFTQDTIRDYLVLVFNWKNSNPRISTQKRLIDMLSNNQFEELSEITKTISVYSTLGMASAKYIASRG